MSLLEQEDWTRWPPDVLSNLNHSVILWFWGTGPFASCKWQKRMGFNLQIQTKYFFCDTGTHRLSHTCKWCRWFCSAFQESNKCLETNSVSVSLSSPQQPMSQELPAQSCVIWVFKVDSIYDKILNFVIILTNINLIFLNVLLFLTSICHAESQTWDKRIRKVFV